MIKQETLGFGMKINNLLCLVLVSDSLAGFRLVYMAVAHENAAFFYYDGKA